MSRTLQAYKTITTLRERYSTLKIGQESLLAVLAEAEIPEQVYNSNAIENSTLTLEETEKILIQIDLDRYISERELFETKNLARVMVYIGHTAHEKPLTLGITTLLHKMLIANIRDDIAGRFREESEWVRVGNYIAADPKDVVRLVTRALSMYESTPQEHIVRRVARFHLTFERIHPFVDGNGRIGRVINNYLLLRDGYVPINIAFIDRALYYEAFKEFDRNGQTDIMEGIVARAITMSYHKRLAYLEHQEIISIAEYAHRTKTSHQNLLNKAKRQTIPAFLEKGTWKIGIAR